MQTTKTRQLAKTYHHRLKVLTILATVLLSLPNFCSGSTPLGPFLTMYLPQGHVIDSFSGYGYNPSTLATRTTIGCTNPASLIDLKRGFGFSYQYDTKIDPAWLDIIGYQRKSNAVPQSAGLSIPLRNLHLGIAMNQIYNAESLYDRLTGTIVKMNEQGYIDTIGTMSSNKNEASYQYSLTTAYNLNQLLAGNQSLSLGFQINYNRYNLFESINTHYYSDSLDFLIGGTDQGKNTINAFNVAAGIRYTVCTRLIPRIHIGAYYETFVRFKKTYEDDNFDWTLLAEIPDKFHTGLYLETPSGLFLSGNLSYLFWRNTEYSVKNQPEFAVNIGFPACKSLTLSGGVFYTHYRRTDFSDKMNDKFKAVYLIAGGTAQIKDVSIELTVADSHLFSGEYRKQTLMKAGVGYSF